MSSKCFLSLKNHLEESKKNSLTIGLCHGCFDILHSGHVEHFRFAKQMVDILVVSLTADQYVNKGKNRPIFKQLERENVVSSLKYVDFTIINDYPDCSKLLNSLPIDIYFKGPDYNVSSSHSGLQQEIKSLPKHIKVIFTPTHKLSSSYAATLLEND